MVQQEQPNTSGMVTPRSSPTESLPPFSNLVPASEPLVNNEIGNMSDLASVSTDPSLHRDTPARFHSPVDSQVNQICDELSEMTESWPSVPGVIEGSSMDLFLPEPDTPRGMSLRKRN